MTNIERWSVLAGMRFVLACIVAVNHLDGRAPAPWTGIIASFGSFEAVMGFLLISGYSIGHSYQVKPEDFLLRRVKRLYPVYLASLAVTVFVVQFASSPRPPMPWLELLLNALLLNQLFTSTSYLGPAWSLALEFWLYCLAPVLMALKPQRIRAIIFASLACYVVYALLWPVLKLPYFTGLGWGLNLPLLSFTWVAGLRLSQSSTQPREALRDVAVLFATHWTITAARQAAYRFKNHAVDDFLRGDLPAIFAQGVTLAVVWLVFRWIFSPGKEEGRKSVVLRLLGDVSYPLYLLHVPVIMYLKPRGCQSAVLLFAASIVAAAAAYFALDSYSRKRHLAA